MTDKILKIAKRLKTFTLEDIVMFTGPVSYTHLTLPTKA